MWFHHYPALYQNPQNLMNPNFSIDKIREAENKNIEARIKEAVAINAKRASLLNWLRIATALSPIFFVVVASITPNLPLPAKEKAKLACKTNGAASAPVSKIECEVSDWPK
jgi:hypothetical protein